MGEIRFAKEIVELSYKFSTSLRMGVGVAIRLGCQSQQLQFGKEGTA